MFPRHQPTIVVCRGGGLNKYQGFSGDCLQRPLRSRFRQWLKPSADMTSDVKGWELLFYVLSILPVHFIHRKSRSQ
jgi:hypothetical protein